MHITSEQADTIIRAATSKAKNIGIAVVVVVMDNGGHLKAFSRMDGSWLGSIDVAMKKAKTAVLFETDTETVWEFSNPDAQAHGMEFTNDGLITFAGGIPLKDPVGQLAGSIGVSGGQVIEDLEIARAGLAAFAAT